jgi:hypothetical protein
LTETRIQCYETGGPVARKDVDALNQITEMLILIDDERWKGGAENDKEEQGIPRKNHPVIRDFTVTCYVL